MDKGKGAVVPAGLRLEVNQDPSALREKGSPGSQVPQLPGSA